MRAILKVVVSCRLRGVRRCVRACVSVSAVTMAVINRPGQSGEGGQAVGYIVLVLGMLVLLVIGWRFVGDGMMYCRVLRLQRKRRRQTRRW